MTSPGPVKTWRHSRKGLIRGRIVEELGGDWVEIEMAEAGRLNMISAGADADYEKGEVITVRKSFLTEVPDSPVPDEGGGEVND